VGTAFSIFSILPQPLFGLLELLDEVLPLLPLALEVAQDVKAGLPLRLKLLPEGGLALGRRGQLLLATLDLLLRIQPLFGLRAALMRCSLVLVLWCFEPTNQNELAVATT